MDLVGLKATGWWWWWWLSYFEINVKHLLMGHGFYSHVKLQEGTSGAWTNQNIGDVPTARSDCILERDPEQETRPTTGVIRIVQVTVHVISLGYRPYILLLIASSSSSNLGWSKPLWGSEQANEVSQLQPLETDRGHGTKETTYDLWWLIIDCHPMWWRECPCAFNVAFDAFRDCISLNGNQWLVQGLQNIYRTILKLLGIWSCLVPSSAQLVKR